MVKEKSFPEVIELVTEYKDVMNRLKRVKENTYKLETNDYPVKVWNDYDYTEITMINPFGGPKLSTGEELEGFIINSIRTNRNHEFIIELI